jgi:glycosyltransferase involved in cell wall biosynthesis
VRQPVMQTGMGAVVPIGDPDGLAEAVIDVLDNRAKYVRPPTEIASQFSTARTTDGYLTLFEQLLRRKNPRA